MSKQLSIQHSHTLANLSPYQRFQIEKYGNVIAGGMTFDQTDLAREDERIREENWANEKWEEQLNSNN